LWLRAPWLTQGYYKEPEKGAELWENGWLHTGDVASISPDGVLEIKDRIKDVIKTGGGVDLITRAPLRDSGGEREG